MDRRKKQNNVTVRTERAAIRERDGDGTAAKKMGFDFSYFFSAMAALLVALLSVMLVIYFGYHLVMTFTSEISTIRPQTVSEAEYRIGQGYIFRDERPVAAPTGGVPDYALHDGERVALGEKLCTLYTSLSDDKIAKLEAIDREIALLEASIDPGVISGGLPAATEEVSKKYAELMLHLGRGDYEMAASLADSLRASMNHVEWLVGNTEDLSLKISSLLSERSALLATFGNAVGNVNSDGVGYFFHELDGYEEIFSASALDGLTVGGFCELIEKEPQSTQGYVGKLVPEPVWYLAIPFSGDDAEGFVEGDEYNILFCDNKSITVRMKLERIVLDLDDYDSDTDRREAVLLFSTSKMPADFDYIRTQNVYVEYKTYEGYRVPFDAVHHYEDMLGVFTQSGGYVLFRQISPIYEGEGYYIAADYKSAEKGLPKTYPCLGFSDYGCFDDYASLRELAQEHGWERTNYDNGGVGVVKGQKLKYYYHLNEHELIITQGHNLYHGKALN